MKRYRPVSLKKIRTYPLSRRKSKVSLAMFAKACRKGGSFQTFLDSLPNILAAKELKGCVDAIVRARKRSKPVIAAMGGHVVKCGLNRVIIDLMRRGVVTALAMNGATSIHDFEIALAGKTSEDVEAGLENGTFGMAEETAALMNDALASGDAKELGAGWAIGRYILEKRLPHRDASLLAQAVRMRLPATVHIAIGTDIIHQHPQADGAILGRATMNDFRLFADVVGNLGNGGVMLNIGSAVILPEVFLKALTVARNSGRKVTDFTAVTLDMLVQYRPLQNVVRRPVATGGSGHYIIGHHEIMIPLLSRAIIERL
ncbi:MAG: hypothetical protein P8Y85_04615 [Nitrospirota bacterium]